MARGAKDVRTRCREPVEGGIMMGVFWMVLRIGWSKLHELALGKM